MISVCRRRSVGSKQCANGFCYICEFCERKKIPSWEKKLLNVLHASHFIARVFSISHRFTQKTRTHKGQKDDGPSPDPSWPLPLPLPRREGEWLPRYPYGLDVGFVLSLISFENSSNVLWYLYAGGVLWDRNCAQMRSVTSVSSVRERNTLCERERFPLW